MRAPSLQREFEIYVGFKSYGARDSVEEHTRSVRGAIAALSK